MKRLCVFGDSITKGVILSDNGRYHILKENCVSLLCEGKGFDCDNYSKMGCTVEKGGEIFYRHEKEVERSQAVLFEFGGNDSDFDWKAISRSPECSHTPNTILDEYVSRYKELIDVCIEKGTVPFVMNLPPVDAELYFVKISQGLDKDNIMSWLGGSTSFIYRWHETYNQALSAICQDTGAKMLDIRSPFLSLRNYREYLCSDGIHPNEKGHLLIRETLEAQLR